MEKVHIFTGQPVLGQLISLLDKLLFNSAFVKPCSFAFFYKILSLIVQVKTMVHIPIAIIGHIGIVSPSMISALSFFLPNAFSRSKGCQP